MVVMCVPIAEKDTLACSSRKGQSLSFEADEQGHEKVRRALRKCMLLCTELAKAADILL